MNIKSYRFPSATGVCEIATNAYTPENGVFDTVLWGRYMVYAAAFGISDKLMEQMERAYPQLADPEWANVHTSNDSLVYWSARRRAMRARGVTMLLLHASEAGRKAYLKSGYEDVDYEMEKIIEDRKLNPKNS